MWSILFLLGGLAAAQQQAVSSPPDTPPNPNFNPSMAIVIVVLISAFFFLGFFSIYIRQCAGDESLSVRFTPTAAARSRRGPRGLPHEVIETFPTLVYSEVKAHKIGKGALECAVCLSEFIDEENLRLLPRCSHVFHPDCIDAWLENHVTCPVCRNDLTIVTADEEADVEAGTDAAVSATSDHLISDGYVNPSSDEVDIELSKLRSARRPAGRFPRSHSTGHSDGADRYTLRLPESIRREIFAATKLHRSRSCVAFPTSEEGSTRRGFRWWGGGGEGSSRGGRSIRLGRSDRWPSFFMRTLSAKFPAWSSAVKKDGEGSLKRGEGSMKRREAISPFDCLGGGGAKGEVAGEAAGGGEESRRSQLQV